MQIDVHQIQLRLKEFGIDPGPVDGELGPQTINAIRGFQRMSGLKPDGKAGPLTIEKLWPKPILSRNVQNAVLTQGKWPHEIDVELFYGPMGQNQAMLELPYPMKLAWDKRIVINRFSIHEKVLDSAKRCFDRIADAYTPEQREDMGIDLFGGCLNVRLMRGSKNRWSMHSWGIAIDFDPARNDLHWGREKARLAKSDCNLFWKIWEDEGAISLGRTKNYDWMHVQFARL